jgi:hypothetical protein
MAIAAGVAAARSPESASTGPAPTAHELAVADGATIQEATSLLPILDAIGGRPAPDDAGRFPREFLGQVLFARDRCLKVADLPEARLAAVSALQAALMGFCNKFISTGGLEPPDATYPGEPHVPARVESDQALQRTVKEMAARATDALRSLVAEADTELAAALKGGTK